MRTLMHERIKMYRKAKGYTQKKVEELTGITDTTLSRIEAGKHEHPHVSTLEKLAVCYGCTVDDFYVDVREVLPLMVEREFNKTLRHLKFLIAGSTGELDEFTIELKLKGKTTKVIRYAGKING